MQPFTVPYGETWTVLSAEEDRTGDQALEAIATIEQCVYWSQAATESTGGYPEEARDSAAISGTLAVPKSATIDHLIARVRREATGQVYRVVGPAQWDQLHPMTGWDTGYKTFTVRAVA